jgi:hypothetical protein
MPPSTTAIYPSGYACIVWLRDWRAAAPAGAMIDSWYSTERSSRTSSVTGG